MDGFGGVLSAQVTCGVLNWTRGLNTLSHRCLTGQTGGDELATPPIIALSFPHLESLSCSIKEQ